MTPRPRPTERFLGPDEARGGPFALLGVDPEGCTDDAVLSGLDHQLERLLAHPECDTPEADEVRLALHAAAAQLLDPVVRRQLVAKWTGSAPPPRDAASAPEPPRAGAPRRLLEHDAVLSLGLHGGWNERSLHHLAAIAHARGMGSEHVASALRTLAKKPRPARPPAPSRPRGPAPRSSQPLPEQIDPAFRLLWLIALFGGGGVVLAALAVWLVVRLVTAEPAVQPAPPRAPTPVAASPPDAPRPAASVPPALTPPDLPRPTETLRPAPGEIARGLAACTSALSTDPAGALAQFRVQVGRLGRVWGLLPRDELVATCDAVVEFVYRAGAGAESAVAIVGEGAERLSAPSVAASPDAVPPAVWSLGMLARLWHETNLPATAKAEIERRLSIATASGSPVQERTFHAGAAAALAILPGRILPRPADPGATPADTLPAWRKWIESVDAWAARDERAAGRVLLDGLQTVLISGAEPSDQRVYALIVELVQRLKWRDGDPARARLLRWFDDPRVSGADLHALTSTMATRSAAEGVDITMVLAPGASDRVRGDLRERYARLWSLDLGVDRMALDADWLRDAQDAVARSLAARTQAEHLASAVILSRVNESAWRRWRGDAEESMRLLDDLSGDVDAVVPVGGGAPPVTTPPADAGWGEKYLAARRGVPQRMELLARLQSTQGSLGAVDAEVLVQDALFGTPAEVRVRAAEVVRQFQDSPAVVNAVLEFLPRAPRIAHTSQLIEAVSLTRLPPVSDAAWPAAARRALVERYLERVTAEGSLAPIDRLAQLLAVSYRGLASEAVLSPAQRTEQSQPPAGESARSVWSRWRAEASAVPPVSAAATPLNELDRRRDGRVALAQGPVQRFAAEQVCILEVMAAVVAAEQPARAPAVQAVLDQTQRMRSASATILEQVNVVERGLVKLWELRAHGGESS